MKNFNNSKKHQLSKDDMSKKGSVDKEIKFLLDKINKLKDYYTTSSCAGRVVVLSRKSDKKYDTSWIYVSHKKADFNRLKEALKSLPGNPAWFKQESAILHVCCRNYKAAEKLLIICKETGFKHSGIISLGKRIIVEVTSTENIETIIADNGKLLVTEGYLKVLVEQANRKMERNSQRLERLYKAINS